MDENTPNFLKPQEAPPQSPSASSGQAPSPSFLEPSPKKNFTPKFLVVIAILLAVGAGAFWYANRLAWQNYEKVSEEAMKAQENAPVRTPDPFANWQTYRNEEYGFEFKYPENFILDDSNQTGTQPIYTYVQTDLGYSLQLDSRPSQEDGTPNTIVADLPAFQYSTSDLDEAEIIHTSWNDGDLLFYFSILKDNPGKLDSEAVKTYNQILSTFKFIE